MLKQTILKCSTSTTKFINQEGHYDAQDYDPQANYQGIHIQTVVEKLRNRSGFNSSSSC